MFKSDPNSSENDENTALLAAAASNVSPVNELNAHNRAALIKTATVTHMQRNDQIKPENSHRWLMYLVEGNLSLYNGKDEVGTLSSRTSEALQPLFDDKSYQSVKTSSMAKVVRFGREQMDILLREQQKNAINVVDVEVSELDNLLFDDIRADIQRNKVTLGSFGESSAKILGALNNSAGIPELAEVIQSDPGLAASIVVAANRTEAGAADPVQTIRGAISRLGVEATIQAITELLRSNTLIPANDAITSAFARYISRSAVALNITNVLAKEVNHLQADVAMLTALTSDIGELVVLTYANKHADRFTDEDHLNRSINSLRDIVGSWLLSSWDFPQEFVTAAETSRQWYRNLSGDIGYADLVTAALLIIQSEMPDGGVSSIPSADNLLLARRLQQAGIDIKSPESIVKAASARLINVQGLLKAS